MKKSFCFILLLLPIQVAPAQSTPDPVRPNFVFFLTDDLRFDAIGCAGNRIAQTPNIDRLASQGVRFDQAFVTTSICCVSRASFFTGRLARLHRVPDFQTPLPKEVLETSLPALLKKAGYRTGIYGKWGIGGPEPRELFDEWFAWGGQGNYFHNVNGEKIHNSEMLARKAEAFIANPSDGPFCLFVLEKAPHDPLQPDPQFDELYSKVQFVKPLSYTDAHFATLPEFMRVSEGRIRERKHHPDEASYQEFVRKYYRLVTGADRCLGRILDALKKHDIQDRTVTIFSSDNGFFLGEHGLSHKWLMYEESIRVPLIIHDPRAPRELQGRTLSPIALNIDVAPTILELAELEIPSALDGKSLVPWLYESAPARGGCQPLDSNRAGEYCIVPLNLGATGSASAAELKETGGSRPPLAVAANEWRKDFFYEYHYHHGGVIPRCEGVRNSDFKYVRYFVGESPYIQLFDLRADPFEMNNLAEDPKYQEELNKLSERYESYVRELPPAVVPPLRK